MLRTGSGVTGPKLCFVITGYKINYSISDLIFKHYVENRKAVHNPKYSLFPFNGLNRKSIYAYVGNPRNGQVIGSLANK